MWFCCCLSDKVKYKFQKISQVIFQQLIRKKLSFIPLSPVPLTRSTYVVQSLAPPYYAKYSQAIFPLYLLHLLVFTSSLQCILQTAGLFQFSNANLFMQIHTLGTKTGSSVVKITILRKKSFRQYKSPQIE